MMPKNTAKIMRFLLRSGEKHNINQIARAVKVSIGSAFKILKNLERDKIAAVQNIGNATYYELNLDNPETAKLCELLLIEERRTLTGYARLYSESLQEFSKAELIVLFGSVLSKKEFNDVDVLFVSGNVKAVNEFCLELSKVRTKPVVPLILHKKDLVNELKKGKAAIRSIIKEGIVLRGESIFVEVIKNAKK